MECRCSEGRCSRTSHEKAVRLSYLKLDTRNLKPVN